LPEVEGTLEHPPAAFGKVEIRPEQDRDSVYFPGLDSLYLPVDNIVHQAALKGWVGNDPLGGRDICKRIGRT
jgi:hypothetical protein